MRWQPPVGGVLARIPEQALAARLRDVTFSFERNAVAAMGRIVAVPALPDGWRGYFAERLAALG